MENPVKKHFSSEAERARGAEGAEGERSVTSLPQTTQFCLAVDFQNHQHKRPEKKNCTKKLSAIIMPQSP